jgi:hypothetical protein
LFGKFYRDYWKIVMDEQIKVFNRFYLNEVAWRRTNLCSLH